MSDIPWNNTLNSDTIFADFLNDLNKDVFLKNSKGNFVDDYNYICQEKNIIPCPFFQYNKNEKGISYIRLCHVKPDLSSWRAFLLAYSMNYMFVEEIILYSIELTPQHITNFTSTLKKSFYLKSLRMEYLVLSNGFNDDQYCDALKVLISNEIIIDYLSFQGSNLGNLIVSSLIYSLSTNLTIKALNLSNCYVTNDDIISLIPSLKNNLSLELLSLSNNQINGNILTNIGEITNSIASVNEINNNNQLLKKVVEINKKIKDSNKKRKNNGVEEIHELIIQNDRIMKADNQQVLSNKILKLIDLSYNPILNEYINEISSRSNNNDQTMPKLKIKLKGINNSRDNRNDDIIVI